MSNEASNEDFNGWCNRETWATALHLSNDEELYKTCLELVEGKKEWSGGDAIEAWVTHEVNELLYGGFYSEWVSMLIDEVGSFWRVDWQAVAASFIES